MNLSYQHGNISKDFTFSWQYFKIVWFSLLIPFKNRKKNALFYTIMLISKAFYSKNFHFTDSNHKIYRLIYNQCIKMLDQNEKN